jgi:hypothetical protein
MLSCSTARRSSFPIATLLGRRPVVAQRTRQVIPFHVFLQRDRCECCPGSKQVVATAVAWRIGHHRATIRRGGLRKARQRVKFAQDSDDGLAASPRASVMTFSRFNPARRKSRLRRSASSTSRKIVNTRTIPSIASGARNGAVKSRT